MLNDFIDYLNAQVGQPYVWGGQHLVLNRANYETVIKARETSKTHEQDAIEFCKKKFKRGATELYGYDCSGLGMYFLQNLKKLFKGDLTADGMKSQCTIVSTKPKKGYWVFRMNGNRAVHIGYMVSDCEVIHSKGREYGVVKEIYNSAAWGVVGIPKVFAKEINETQKTNAYVFKRILKYGCRGEDVKELKKVLISKGYKGITATNRNYLISTKRVVKQFQKNNGLKVDGICGKNTYTKLGVKFSL